MAALIGVENLWLGDAESPFQCGDTERGIQRVGQLPGEDIATEPVDNGREIQKPMLQPDVGDVGAPDLIHAHDRDVTQEIRKDPVLGIPLGQPRLGIDSFQTHQPHQALNALPVERYSVCLPEPLDHFTCAIEGRPGVLFIN